MHDGENTDDDDDDDDDDLSCRLAWALNDIPCDNLCGRKASTKTKCYSLFIWL